MASRTSRRTWAPQDHQHDRRSHTVATRPKPSPPPPRPLVRWGMVVAVAVVVGRVLNALLIGTSFVPDEYWQALEVAHHHVFGYGHLTWEWQHRLRGFLHPGMFAVVFEVLRLLGMDTPLAIGLVQSVGDGALYLLARRLHGPHVAAWALGCQLLSWFTFYCGVRTVSNSMETVLVTIVLLCWPWEPSPTTTPAQRKLRCLALVVGAFAFIVRPTSAVVFAWLGLRAMWFYSPYEHYLFYHELTLVPWNFVKFNIGQNISSFYGTHPIHWYITQGLPTILGSFLPTFLLGVWLAKQRNLFYVLVWSIFIYSLLPHKEFRFIFPILPIAHVYSGLFLNSFYSAVMATNNSTASSKRKKIPLNLKHSFFYATCAVLVLTHAGMAFYFSFWHQRGPIDVMKYLRQECDRLDNQIEIFFLMPCHSTPYYAYIHRPIAMDFLPCLPPIKYNGNTTYEDQTALFFQNPQQFLVDHFEKEKQYPTHMVLFEPLLPAVSSFLSSHGYHEAARFWHSQLVVDARQGDVLVYQLK